MMDAISREPYDVTFDFRALSAREKYKLMIGTVVPRPIALVTTVDLDGRVNAADLVIVRNSVGGGQSTVIRSRASHDTKSGPSRTVASSRSTRVAPTPNASQVSSIDES